MKKKQSFIIKTETTDIFQQFYSFQVYQIQLNYGTLAVVRQLVFPPDVANKQIKKKKLFS